MRLFIRICGLPVMVLFVLQITITAKGYKGFSAAQIEKCFVSKAPVVQILKGKIDSHFSISSDGKWIAFTNSDSSTENQTIFVVRTDGSIVKKFREPYGRKKQFKKRYLNVPTVFNDHLYIYYTPPTGKKLRSKAKGRKKGIYVFNLNNPASGWKPVRKKSFFYRITDPIGRYYLNKIGRNYQIQFTERNQKIGKPLWLIKDFIRKDHRYAQIGQYFLNQEKDTFYFAYSYHSKKEKRTYYSLHAINLENKSGVEISKPTLIKKNISSLTMSLDTRVKNITLYTPLFLFENGNGQNFSEETLAALADHTQNNSKIMALNVKTGKSNTIIRCVNGAYCNDPKFFPNSNRFFFFAQNSDKHIYGLFTSTVNMANYKETTVEFR